MSDQSSVPLSDSGTSERSTSLPTSPGVHNLDRSVCAFDSFEYEADGNVFHATYAAADTEQSVAAVSALAVVTDTDPFAVGPLHDAVDTDALETIFANAPDSQRDLSVTFTVRGHTVTLNAGGTLSVRPPEAIDS